MQDQIEAIRPNQNLQDDKGESDALFRQLVDSVQDYAIFTLDVDGLITTWNSGAVRLKGYSAEDIIGKHYSMLFLPADAAKGKPERELEIARRDGVCEEEGWRVRKDGSRLWANVTVTAMHDSKGMFCGYSKVTRDISEKTLMRDQMAAFFSLSFDFLLVAGFDGLIKRVNPKWEAMLGLTSEELSGVPWLDFVHPDDIENTIRAGASLSEGENVLCFENRYRCKDGTYRWLLWNAVSYPQQQLSFAVGRDITDAKENEENGRRQTERLLESERTLEEAQQIAKIGNWELDLVTEKVTWSKQLFTLLGGDSPFGENDLESNLALYCPEDAVRVKAALELAVAEGIPYALDLRLKSNGGPTTWVHAIGKPVCDESGKTIRLVGIVMDITERKKHEEVLWEAGERLQQATDAGSMGVWEFNIATNVLTWDDRMMSIYAFTPEAFPGAYEAWSERLHPEDRVRAEAELKKAIEGGKKFDTEFRLLLPLGVIRYIKADATVLKDEHGAPTRMIGINQDITEKMITEEQLRHFATDQETANIRLRLSEERLQRQSQELIQSNTDLEQFAHVASHDLQEPLRMVASFMQLLEKKYKGQLDEQADRWIEHAVDGATRMQALIQDLLAYSRLGSHCKEFRECHMSEIVSISMKNLHVAIDETEANIICGPLPSVIGDDVQLVSLFQNLISNALKYRREDRPCIRISAERLGSEWRFAISDNGIGIETQFSERIFVIFQRLHTRKAYPGTGVGLSLCKRIVERHGGRIWMESEPGNGTTFFFNLPA